MGPTHFRQSNRTLTAPSGKEDQVDDLPVHVAVDDEYGPMCISRWQLTDEERRAIADGAPVWLFVYGATTHPPIALVAQHSVFTEDQENDNGS